MFLAETHTNLSLPRHIWPNSTMVFPQYGFLVLNKQAASLLPRWKVRDLRVKALIDEWSHKCMHRCTHFAGILESLYTSHSPFLSISPLSLSLSLSGLSLSCCSARPLGLPLGCWTGRSNSMMVICWNGRLERLTLSFKRCQVADLWHHD